MSNMSTKLALVAVVILAGCGTPHVQSKAEQARKAAQKKHDEAVAARQHLAAMRPLPPGIEQMDSTHFYIHWGYESNVRDLCRSSGHESSAGIETVERAPNGTHDLIVVCRNPEHEYRHPPLTRVPIK